MYSSTVKRLTLVCINKSKLAELLQTKTFQVANCSFQGNLFKYNNYK